MRKTFLLAALGPAVLVGAAAPASAQDWRHDNYPANHYGEGRYGDGRHGEDRADRGWQMTPQRNAMIRADVEQLDNAIMRAAQNRTISWREAQGLRMQARQVKQMYWGYSRDGLNRREMMALEQRVNQIRGQLRMERRDWNNWRG